MITESDLTAARQAWGDGLVAISRAFDTAGVTQARSLANRLLDKIYGFELGPVLFKPTMASGEQTFRSTQKGALSYFVAHDPDFPLDSGFALKGWRQVTTETSASFVEGTAAMWMGWMHFTDKDGQVTTVDKSFGYKKDQNGVLRLMLHHSSFPFQP